MNQKASLALLLFLIPAVMLSHLSWSQTDNGLLFNVDGRDVDVVGILKDTWRTSTQTCDAVTQLPSADVTFKEIKTQVQAYSPPHSASIKRIHIWTFDSWAVAQVEFDSLLPAVVAVKTINTQATVVDDAIWSGMTAPWKPGPFIRTYLGNRNHDIPQQLLNCFELQTGSFQ